MAELADEVTRLVGRLDLGESHYLTGAMRPEVTGSSEITQACNEFENEWAFGRDRLTSSLNKLIGFLQSAAQEYGETDAQMAIDAMTIGMTDEQETAFRRQVEGSQKLEY